MGTLTDRVKSRLEFCAQAVLGEAQRTLRLPVTCVGTHRQAVEQWKQQLVLPPDVHGRVLVSALRNRSWIGVGAYTACVLRQIGYETTLLFRRSDIVRFFPSRSKRFSFWEGVAGIPGIRLLDLESVSVTEADMEQMLGAARLAAPSALAYDLHLEEQDIRDGDATIQAALQRMTRMMMRIGAAAKKVLLENEYYRLILYSGLIGESPVILACARQLGVPTVCVEGWAWRSGHLLYNHNAPALDYDVQGWLRRIHPWDDEKEREVNQYINFLDGRYNGGSKWLDDFYLVQASQVSETLPPDLRDFVQGTEKLYLAAPNVVGDSSMLTRETIFSGQQVWCKALIDYFRGKPGAKLLIRAHPAEVWMRSKVRIRMAEVAHRHAEGASNIYVVDAGEKVNTFSLLPFVDAGLVWLSSIGVDMVVRGVPVIAAARPKYTGLGIVAEPASAEEYFSLIESWLDSSQRPTEQQVLMAKKYLYIVFKALSYEAWGRNTFATSCRLNDMPNQEEHDAFYRALVGKESSAA